MKIQLLLISCGVAHSFLLRSSAPTRDTKHVPMTKMGEGAAEVVTKSSHDGKFEFKFVNGFKKGTVDASDTPPGIFNNLRNIVARTEATNTEAQEMQDWLRGDLAGAVGVDVTADLALRGVKTYGVDRNGVDFSGTQKAAVCGRDWGKEPLPLGTYMWMDAFVLQLVTDSFSYTQSTDSETMLEKLAAFRHNMGKMTTDPAASMDFLVRYFFPDFSQLSYPGFSFAVMYYGGRLPEFQCWMTFMITNKCGGFKPDLPNGDRTAAVRAACEDSATPPEVVLNLFKKEELTWYYMNFPEWSQADFKRYEGAEASVWEKNKPFEWDPHADVNAVPEEHGLYSMQNAKYLYPKQFACLTLAMIEDGCGNSMYPGGNVKWDSKYSLYNLPYTGLPAVWKDNNRLEWNYYKNNDGSTSFVVDSTHENSELGNGADARAIAR